MDNYGFDGPRRPLVWRILLAPFTFLGRLFERFAAGDDLQGHRGVLGWLKLIFVSPFVWMFTSLGTLLLGWSSSRQTAAFFLGIPSFLLGLIFVSVYAYGTLTPRRMIAAYKHELQQAQRKDELEAAEVYLNKLMRIDTEDLKERRLEKVELLQGQEKMADAYRLLLEMTNTENAEAVGNATAHAKLAVMYLSKEFREFSNFEELEPAEKRQFQIDITNQARQQFELCLAASPNDAEEYQARRFLYLYHVQRKDYTEAIPHISYLHRVNPLGFAIPHYSFFTVHVPRVATAEDAAQADADRFAKLLKENPNNVTVWKGLIKFHAAVGTFQRAVQDLQKFATPDSREQQFQRNVMLAGVYTLWANDLKKKDPVGNRMKRLEFLSLALSLYPARETIAELILLGFPFSDQDDTWLYDAQAQAKPRSPTFYGVKMILGLRAAYDGNAEEARARLKEAENLNPTMPLVLKLLQSTLDEDVLDDDGNPIDIQQLAKEQGGVAIGGIYMILGSHAVSLKDFARGQEFFQKALDLNPESVNAKNNLAVCMAQVAGQDSEMLNQALTIANEAIAAQPQVANYYETRGAIYLKLERYEEAIGDLEQAMALGYSNQKSIWQKLVRACRAVGRTKEADAYVRSLESIGATVDSEDAPQNVSLDAVVPETDDAGDDNEEAIDDASATDDGEAETPAPAQTTSVGQ